MAYCTLENITNTVPEQTIINLTDDAAVGVIDPVKVDTAIADAEAEVDSYCATRYQVPFAVVPPIVRKITTDIAIYNLYSRCAETVPEIRETRYKSAIKLLENIAKGIVALGELPAPAAAPQSSVTLEVTSNPRLFTRDTTRGL